MFNKVIVANRGAVASRVLRALNEMNQSLVHIVGEVRRGTDTIASASADIARGNVVTGRKHLRAEILRGVEQIVEFHRHVAVDAGHRRLPRHIALGEAIDHGFPESLLVVEDVVRDADPVGHRAGPVLANAGLDG